MKDIGAEMPAIADLDELLKSMSPVLGENEYVFCSIQSKTEELGKYEPWPIIDEEEGKTVIIAKEIADLNSLIYESVFSRITLSVHSSLNAVGLAAKER
jgi:uncharacterized protein